MKRYRIFIDPNEGVLVYKNSIVKRPAHEKQAYAFNSQNTKYEFDDVKQNIVGVAIAPDVPIYRNNPQIGEHEVVFAKEDIEVMAYAYGKQGFFNELTFNHNDKEPVKSASMYLSIVVDSKNGITAPKMFENEADGTWILGYHFEDKKEYEYARDNFSGWSVEGDFYLEEIIKNQNKMEKSMFKKLADIFASFSEEENTEEVVENTAKFERGELADGTIVEWEGELEVGTALFVVTVDEGGEEVATPAPDGQHTLADGRVVTTTDGLIDAIEEVAPEEEVEDFTEAFEMTVKIVEKFSEKVTALQQENKELKENFEAMKTAFEALKKEPVEKPEVKKFNLTPKQKSLLK
jgi:hypothetical protein